MPSFKRKVKVTTVREIEVELTESVFGDMTEEEYLKSFRSGLWHVDSMDDVIKYAARCAASGGGCQEDGLGYVGDSDQTRPCVPDVKFDIIDVEIEEELIS